MAPMVYAALYIRKSNKELEQKSLKRQIAEGREYCKRMGWNLRDEHIFIDEHSAYLKSADKRQAFITMVNLACAKKPLFSKVVVWKIDRFARRAQDGFKYWQMLHDNDVEVISMTQTFGDGAGGRLNLGMHLMMAQFYSDNLSEDVRAGLKSLALKGFWTSRLVPLGYERYNVEGSAYKLRIVEKDAVVVRQIFDHAIKGWGLKRIGALFNFTTTYIANVLKNENYTGDRVQRNKSKNKILLRVSDAHPAIISKKTFEKAQRSVQSRARTKSVQGVSDSLYSGILKCACGRHMHKQHHKKNQGKYCYYHCNGKRIGNGCISGNVREDQVTQLLLNLIEDKLFSADAIKQMFKMAETKRKNGDLEKATRHLNRELAENKGQQRRLIELVRDDVVPMDEIKDDMAQLKAVADDLEAKLDFSPEEPIKPAAMKKLISQLQRDLSKDNDKRQDAMRELVKEIVVDLPLIRVTTSLMTVEDTYDIYYYAPPTVPKDYHNLNLHTKRRIVASIKRFTGDNARNQINYHDDRQASKRIILWTSAELDAFIENYILTENAVYTLVDTENSDMYQSPTASTAA
jgi:site-specific DNA recombinase